MRIIELRQTKAALTKMAEEILSKAENEKRDLTLEERERYEALLESIQAHNEEIRRLEETEQRAKALASGGGQYLPSSPDAVRALRPEERITDYLIRERRDILPDGVMDQTLSLGKMLRGIVTGDWRGAEAERRAMGIGTDSLGGFLVPHPLSSRIIDLARAQARVIQAGALTVPMDSSTLRLAKVLTDPRGYWKPENAAITESDMTFGPLELKAKTLAALVRVSVELLEDAQNLGQVVETALSEALGLELDRAALLGSGVGEEPLGVYNIAGVTKIDMGDNGAALTDYVPFSKAAQAVQEANGTPVTLLWAPRTAGETERLKDTTGQPLQPPQSFQALRKYPTTQIPTNLTKGTATNATFAVVGDFSNLLIGVRTNLLLEASREANDAFKNLQVLIRAYLRADVAIARPNHFAIVDGIIPPA